MHSVTTKAQLPARQHDCMPSCIGALFVRFLHFCATCRNVHVRALMYGIGFLQDLSDFVEYLYGGINTRWGALRAGDGHPAPYPAVAIEISNEACMDSFNGISVTTFTRQHSTLSVVVCYRPIVFPMADC